MTEEMRIAPPDQQKIVEQKKAALKSAISFLRDVYKDSVEDVAALIVAEANEDTDTIVEYLTEVEDFIRLRKELLQ